MDNNFLALIRSKLITRADKNPAATKPEADTEEQRNKFIQELLNAGEIRMAVDYAFNAGDKTKANTIASKFFKDTKTKFNWNRWMTDRRTFSSVARSMRPEERSQLAEDLRSMVPILALSWGREADECNDLAVDIASWYESYRPNQFEIDRDELAEKRRQNRYLK